VLLPRPRRYVGVPLCDTPSGTCCVADDDIGRLLADHVDGARDEESRAAPLCRALSNRSRGRLRARVPLVLSDTWQFDADGDPMASELLARADARLLPQLTERARDRAARGADIPLQPTCVSWKITRVDRLHKKLLMRFADSLVSPITAVFR
jgi:hypothetical protein